MPKLFENNILGMIPKEEWLDVGFEVTRPNDPIDSLFGDDKTDNLVAAYQDIAAEFQIPMMAQFHSFDSETQKTFRVPIDTHNIEKGLIKVKINQSERMRALAKNGITNERMKDYVLNDGIRLADQVVTRTKVAKNEVMAFGKMTIKENNLDTTVDYGVPAEHTAYEFDLSAEADISAQIQQVIDDASAVGITITGMMTAKKNLTKMRSNKQLQKAINGNIGAGAMVRDSALRAYFEEEFGIGTIITNDLTYGASAVIGADDRPVITTARYYPADRITFFATNSAGKMGIGLWGNPPETDVPNFIDVSASGVSPYVFVSQWIENDPTVLWTRASGLFIPVLYNPNSLYIGTIIGETPVTPGLTLDKSTASVKAGETVTITATTVPAGETVTWESSNTTYAEVADGVVTGKAEGSATITASATIGGETYTATCAVTVTPAGA